MKGESMEFGLAVRPRVFRRIGMAGFCLVLAATASPVASGSGDSTQPKKRDALMAQPEVRAVQEANIDGVLLPLGHALKAKIPSEGEATPAFSSVPSPAVPLTQSP